MRVTSALISHLGKVPLNVHEYIKRAVISQNVKLLKRILYSCCSDVDVFPEVSLSFAGGASMVLTPRDYLQMFSSVSIVSYTTYFEKVIAAQLLATGLLCL